MAFYMDTVLNDMSNEFISVYGSYLDGAVLSDTIKFAIFIVFLVIIFVIVWINMLNNLNRDILRAKGVFNLLPTYLLTENTELIKDMSHASIFT